jgi:hypothetical protein
MAHKIWKDLSCKIEEHLSELTLKKILDENGKKYFKTLETNQNFNI